MKRIILIIVLLFIIMPFSTASAQPMDELQGYIDRVIGILKNPRYQEASEGDLQREKLREVIQELFDFKEMAKRALALNWGNFTPKEREQFSSLFAEFLGNAYINKIQGGYRNEKIVYLAQKTVAPSKALVKTKIVRENAEIPVTYSMQKRDRAWRVYDVNIEGVSLVKNYRAQFAKILLRKSPAHLFEMLKKKIDKQQEDVAIFYKFGRDYCSLLKHHSIGFQ